MRKPECAHKKEGALHSWGVARERPDQCPAREEHDTDGRRQSPLSAVFIKELPLACSQSAVARIASRELGTELATKAVTAPLHPRSIHPTAAQKASTFVPGVMRESANDRSTSGAFIHARFETISFRRTAMVALPPPNVKLPNRANSVARSRKGRIEVRIPTMPATSIDQVLKVLSRRT